MSDTEHSVKYHHDGLQEPGQAIHEQLARAGVGCDKIDMILFTHLHWDHCHNLKKFPRARLFVSKRNTGSPWILSACIGIPTSRRRPG